MNDINRILILAPHTDDGEFGCGGSIAKLSEMGKEVHYVAFSDCEKSLPSNVEVKKFEVRCFERDRQEILEEIIKIGMQIKPDLVFLPSPRDLHQDHTTIAMEGLRAFKLSATILGYEMPWNNLTFSTTCFISLTERQLQKKIDALACYKSQSDRFYATEEYIRSLAVTRGTQIAVKYAETFEVLRWIIK